MGVISSSGLMSGVTLQNQWAPHQKLKPEVIAEKIWGEEYTGYGTENKLTWENNSTLSIHLQYGGGCTHHFKAYLLETSLEKKSFTLFLEDQVKNDFNEGGLQTSIIDVDLTAYATAGTTFKVLQQAFGASARILGEITFPEINA